ncbi:MAG: asparagine synthetase B, partial [Bacteroidetes bacterium]|nr:asparagine synthetase B [Bacteroidota bacterium]
ERLKKFYQRYPSLLRKGIGAGMRLLNQRYQRAARLLDFDNPNDFFVQLWSQEQYMFSEKEIEGLTGSSYSPEVLKGDWSRIEQMPFTDEKKISLFDIQHYLANNLLFKMDSASMANSLEVRTPYLDYRLVEFSVNLPQLFKINNGTQKYLMKKLLERYLPKDLVYRTKWGFPAPLGDWLYGDLHYMIERWLSKEQINKTGILDPKTVEKLLRAFKSGKKFHYKRIWSMIIFQMWYDKYMKGNDH